MMGENRKFRIVYEIPGKLPSNAEAEKEPGRISQIEHIIAALCQAGVRFWRNEDGAAFATVHFG